MLRLSVEQGPDAGRVFLTRNNHAVVGRHGEINLSDRNVSMYHALIQIQPNGTTIITDLNSEHGIWFGYGERPAEQLILKSGMCFKVGNSVLRVEIDQPTELDVPVQVPAQIYKVQNIQPLASSVAVMQREESLPVAQRRSNLLELEFDPDILAVAAQQDGTRPVQMEEPEQIIIPDFVPTSPVVAQEVPAYDENIIPDFVPTPTPPRPRRVQTAVDKGASTLVMPFEFRTLTNPYNQSGPMMVRYNQNGWRVALIGGLLLLLILAFIVLALMAF